MRRRSHKFLKAFISTVLVLATVFSVCTPASALTEQSAALAESVTELTVGDTAKLKVNGWNLWVNWSVDDENVATVNSLGVVKAIGEGETTVTACARSLFGMIRKTEFHVVVNPIIPDVTIEIGESADLEISISGTTTWTTSDENIASVDNGTVTGVSEGMVTITATTTKKACGIFWFLFLDKTTKTVTTFTVEVIDSETPSLPEGSTGSVVTAPAEGKAYKFYTKQEKSKKVLYLDGGIDAERSRYFTVTEDYSKAIDIYAESVNDGYKFYTEIDGVKKYIDLYFNDEGKTALRYADTTESVFKYNHETFAWETMLNDTNYYIGTYSTFNDVSVSKTVYITPENTRISQFPLELTTEKISEFSEPPADTEPPIQIPTGSCDYIINKNGFKVHTADCANVVKMNEKNLIDFEGTIDELLEAYPDAISAGCCKPF